MTTVGFSVLAAEWIECRSATNRSHLIVDRTAFTTAMAIRTGPGARVVPANLRHYQICQQHSYPFSGPKFNNVARSNRCKASGEDGRDATGLSSLRLAKPTEAEMQDLMTSWSRWASNLTILCCRSKPRGVVAFQPVDAIHRRFVEFDAADTTATLHPLDYMRQYVFA